VHHPKDSNYDFPSNQPSPVSPLDPSYELQRCPSTLPPNRQDLLPTVDEHSVVELRIASKLKNILFCSISHELRSPINHINGMLELLKTKVDQDELLRYIKVRIIG
jgi:signal transduction histidine kinase